MNTKIIRAVLFDMGGTLEETYFDDALRLEATRGLKEILGKHGIDPGLDVPSLYAVVRAGIEKYNAFREVTEIEAPPGRIWSEFILSDCGLPRAKLEGVGEELAFFLDLYYYKHDLRPETKSLLDVLRARGFRLGVISNVYSRGAVPANLARHGLTEYFQIMLSSAAFGYRKPNPKIFLEAARLIGVAPAECAYVGDTISRDVVGARRAGYGLAIQIKSFLTTTSDRATDVEPPDAVVQNLMEVVNLVSLGE